MTLRWAEVAEAFEFDGSWLDVVVKETSLADWQAVLDALRSSAFGLELRSAEGVVPPPAHAATAFPEDGWYDLELYDLELRAGSLRLHCHFSAVEEIELYLDPREIDGQGALDQLLAVMALLRDACRKPVWLTPENWHEVAIIEQRPGEPPRYVR